MKPPTSALDAITERRILDNLRGLGKGDSGKESPNARSGTTVLLIASKLSTILLADRVVLLERGRMVASGKHHELVANNSAYRELLGLAS